MTVRLVVIGLNPLGLSLGLALGERKDLFYRVGVGESPAQVERVRSLEAFDELGTDTGALLKGSAIVVLALSVEKLEETLKRIAPLLEPQTLVIDTSPVKAGVAEWAQQILPEHAHFLSMTPTLNPLVLEAPEAELLPRADLFQNSLMVISNLPNADSEALRAVADLTQILGAKPLFADLYESDGLFATVDLLPKLSAIALLRATADQPGWSDGRKLAGNAYRVGTAALALDDAETLARELELNRENALRLLDTLGNTLEELKEAIAAGDSEALTSMLAGAQQARERWWEQRKAGSWGPGSEGEEPPASRGSTLGRILGLPSRPKR